MLHIHVFLVAPLGTGHMGPGQHQSRVVVREIVYPHRYGGGSAGSVIQSYCWYRCETSVVGEIAVDKSFLNTLLYILEASFSFIKQSSSTMGF